MPGHSGAAVTAYPAYECDCTGCTNAPFSLDVTGKLRTGPNRLVIRVTNLWPNRLIGDEQQPPDVEYNGDGSIKAWPEWLVNHKPRPSQGRYTFATWRFFTKDSPLLESGLIGPVVVRSAKRVPILVR